MLAESERDASEQLGPLLWLTGRCPCALGAGFWDVSLKGMTVPPSYQLLWHDPWAPSVVSSRRNQLCSA